MSSSAAVEGVAGGIGSLIALVVSYPLKTIYTLQAIRAAESSKGRRLTLQERAALLSDPSRILAQLVPTLRGLFAGLCPAAVETTASSAIYFYAYSLLRGSLVNARRRTAGLPPLPPGSDASRRVDVGVPGSLAVAAVAGVLNMIATSPAQVLTTRMQAASAQRRALEGEGRPTQAAAVRVDVLGVAADIWAADGMAGFWRGLLPNLALVVNPALQYMAYEWLTVRHSTARARRAGAGALGGPPPRLSVGEVFVLGAASKLLATVATYPLIVVKSRLQAAAPVAPTESSGSGVGGSCGGKDEAGADKGGSSACRASSLDVLRSILTEEGLPGLYGGMPAKMLQTVVNAALMLSIKEQVQGSAAATVHAAETLAARLKRRPRGPGLQLVSR